MNLLGPVLIDFFVLLFPLIFFEPDFVGLLAHFVVAICSLDQLVHDVVVRPSACVAVGCIDGREDAASVAFLRMLHELDVVGLDQKSKLRKMRAAAGTSFAFPRRGENRSWRIWRGGQTA